MGRLSESGLEQSSLDETELCSSDARLLAKVAGDSPLRLVVAARLAFPCGGMTASGLRKERDAGRLRVERIAGKEFTTLNAIKDMRDLCLVRQKACGSGLSPQAGTPMGRSVEPSGSSRTESAELALAALLKIVS